MSWKDCADTLLVSRTTLWLQALQSGITAMSEISNFELDTVVENSTLDNNVHEAAFLSWSNNRLDKISFQYFEKFCSTNN